MRRLILLSLLLSVPLLARAVRPAFGAGLWYPGEREELSREVDRLIGNPSQKRIFPRLLLVPHAGYRYSGVVAGRGYAQIRGRAFSRVLILGPSHRGGAEGLILPREEAFSTPLGEVPVDRVALKALQERGLGSVDRSGVLTDREHSVENQLPFLQRALNGPFQILPILVGRVSPEEAMRVGLALRSLVDSETLVVVSTDLTHYGRAYGFTPYSDGPRGRMEREDRGFLETARRVSLKSLLSWMRLHPVNPCGLSPLLISLSLFQGEGLRGETLAYGIGGEGERALVGYGSFVLFSKLKIQKEEKMLAEGEKRSLLKVARRSIEQALNLSTEGGEEVVTPAMKEERGVFVTLRKRGELRGCIGSLKPEGSLYQGVMRNALNAAFRDPRFSPVTEGEWKRGGITLEISALTPLTPVADYKTLRLGTDGVLLSDGFQQAVFLPQVAEETGWDLETFLGHLCMKAGLQSQAFKKPEIKFWSFQAEVWAEE